MKKLKVGILATIAGLLTITAILAVILAAIYAIQGSVLAVIYGLISIPAAFGGRYLFWFTEYKC